MRIALIFDTTRPDTTGIYFERACRVLGIAADHWWLRDASTIPATYDFYVRVDHGDDYLVALPQRLRPVVFYAIDTHLAHSWRKIRRTASRYNLVFCAQRQAAAQLRNGEWLPLGCDWPPEQSLTPMKLPAWDLAFVGTDGGVPRKFYVQVLRERYPKSFIGTADHTRLTEIYRQAAIGFNYSIAGDVNMRIFEVMAARTMLLTNALATDDLARLGFEDRKHLACYRSPTELFALIDHYLAHPEERAAMAQAGCALVTQRHAYVHRMQQLLGVVARRLHLSIPPFNREILTCASS